MQGTSGSQQKPGEAYRAAGEKVASDLLAGHDRLEDQVVVRLSGLIAQEHSGQGSLTAPAYERVCQCLEQLPGRAFERQHLRRMLVLRAQGLVTDAWPMIEEEAARLCGLRTARVAGRARASAAAHAARRRERNPGAVS